MQELDAQIAAVEEEIRQNQNRVKVLQNKYNDATRRERAHRLIERGAILESLLPGLAEMENEGVKALLTAVLSTPATRAVLADFGLV